MGKLVGGIWYDVWYETEKHDGSLRAAEIFVPQLGHRRRISRSGGFKAEAGRYHLYVSLACP